MPEFLNIVLRVALSRPGGAERGHEPTFDGDVQIVDSCR
jgi:hypothetical protein